MKRYNGITLVFSVVTILLFSSCKKQEIPVYSAPSFIQFETSVTDTLLVSFFFQPENVGQVDALLPVKLIGYMPDKDLKYNITVDKSGTTADASFYQLPAEFTYGSGRVSDTARITIKKNPVMKDKSFLLVLEITDADDLFPGQTTNIRKAILINDIVSKPSWWNANMDRFYLGNYSEKKYRLFMQVTGVGDLGKYDPNQQRVYMLQFKYYLMQMKEDGAPVLEEDGTDMLSTVPLIG